MRSYQATREHISKRIVGFLCVLWLGPLGQGVAQPLIPQNEQQFSLAIWQTRQIGLRKDRAQTDILLARLQEEACERTAAQAAYIRPLRAVPWSDSLSTHLYAATFVALGRLGDPRAIPAIESALQDHAASHRLRPFALVALARIKAENAVAHPKTVAEWERKVRVFCRELGLSPREIAEAELSDRVNQPPSLERLALRALAEMAVEAYKGGV